MTFTIHTGDALAVLKTLPTESVHCCVTSPPYWGLRDYGVDGMIGLEDTPDAHMARLVDVFREVRRILRDDGTIWINYGDSYHANVGAGFAAEGTRQRGTLGGSVPVDHPCKPKDLLGLPWMLAFALRADGWFLRSDIIWHKPNPMPESVTDRPTKSHEHLFLLSKRARYFYDSDAVREPHVTFTPESKMTGGRNHIGHAGGTPEQGKNAGNNNLHGARWDQAFHPGGRNLRDVWTIPTAPYPGAHFATFPEALVIPAIKAGCPAGGTVLDPFAGAGTTLLVAQSLGRDSIGIELNPEYAEMARKRITGKAPLFNVEAT